MIPEHLQARTVADIMQRAVARASSEMTVRELAVLLTEEGVTGVPVVDAEGRIEGVVTRSDIVRAIAEAPDAPLDEAVGEEDVDEEDSSPDYFSAETPVWIRTLAADVGPVLDELTVEDIMMPVAFTVSTGEPLPELMRFFLRGRIHRALVVADDRLLGIVTPFDVLRALLEEEGEGEGEPRSMP